MQKKQAMRSKQIALVEALRAQEAPNTTLEKFFVDNTFWSLHKRLGNALVVYNESSGDKLRFIRSLAIQNDQNVYLVERSNGERWVVKWEIDPSNRIPERNPEAAEYERLEKAGAQCPQRLKNYYVLWFEVLVLEFLEPLDADDDPTEVWGQLVTTQLYYIHRYACHADLKPDNIRKRPGKPALFFIIDMNLSKTPVAHGYERMHATPVFTSQMLAPDGYWEAYVAVTYKHDLRELVYVVNQLMWAWTYRHTVYDFKNAESIALARERYGLEPGDFFADPERMSNHPIYQTQRGYKAVRMMLHFGVREPAWSALGGNNRLMNEIDGMPRDPPDMTEYQRLAALVTESQDEILDSKRLFVDINSGCSICSSVAAFKCGWCYHTSTTLCADVACHQKHVCH